MRMMILALLLAAAVPARAQENAKPAGDAAAPSAVAGPYRWARPLAPARAEARASASVAVQDRTDDFLYHVLLTAVSALVTALIWRAVMD